MHKLSIKLSLLHIIVIDMASSYDLQIETNDGACKDCVRSGDYQLERDGEKL